MFVGPVCCGSQCLVNTLEVVFGEFILSLLFRFPRNLLLVLRGLFRDGRDNFQLLGVISITGSSYITLLGLMIVNQVHLGGLGSEHAPVSVLNDHPTFQYAEIRTGCRRLSYTWRRLEEATKSAEKEEKLPEMPAGDHG